jgi:Ca-activated chloride channel family protein
MNSSKRLVSSISVLELRLRLSGRLLVFVCLLLPLNILHAQDAQPSPAQLPTQLVKLTMIVTDKQHHSVDDVRQEEIQLEEDKPAPVIVSFSKDVRPVDYALVIDTSGSFRKVLPAVVETARILINGNQVEDKTFIESFVSSDNIETVQDFTADKAKLNAALDLLYVSGGLSAVIDAVYEAIKHTAEYGKGPAERRRAVVLITDGEDRASNYNSDKLVKLIREKDVQVFVIGIVGLLDAEWSMSRRSARERAELLLNLIADESGGRAFFPEDLKEISSAIAEIQHDLHSQYLVGFETQTKPGEKGFRKVKVKVARSLGRENLTVVTRPGYLVNAQPTVQKASEKKTQ